MAASEQSTWYIISIYMFQAMAGNWEENHLGNRGQTSPWTGLWRFRRNVQAIVKGLEKFIAT